MENTTSVTLGDKTKTTTNSDLQNKATVAGLNSEFTNQEFIIPTDEIELPSQGRFYANKKSSVKIKLMTTAEDEILTSPELIKNGKVLDVLLESSIIDRDLRPADMLICDKNAVLLQLRSSGYGDEYDFKMICPECHESYIAKINISELKYKDLIEPDSNGLYTVTLPKMKAVIKFRLLTGQDEDNISKKIEKQRKLNKNATTSKLLTERYIIQIMDFNGHTDKLYISSAIGAMPISDSFYLREYMRIVEPGIDMEQDFTCEKCGHTYEDNVPISARLFWPNAKY
jgi:hypothetical protein